MKNLAAEIPKRTSINAQIIQQALESEAFQTTVDEVADRYGVGDYQFMNPAYVASLLYCLLVVPHERFLSKYDLFWDNQISAAAVSTHFEIKIADAKVHQNSSQSLRKLRNAVAHARFDINENFVFTFYDGRRPAIDF